MFLKNDWMRNVGTAYAFWKKWCCKTAQSMTALLVDPNHREEKFNNTLVHEVLLEVGKHCKLGAPTLIDKDVIEGTDFTRFFVKEGRDKVYSAAESLEHLPERIFTFDETRTLKVGHFKDLCKPAQAAWDKENAKHQLRWDRIDKVPHHPNPSNVSSRFGHHLNSGHQLWSLAGSQMLGAE